MREKYPLLPSKKFFSCTSLERGNVTTPLDPIFALLSDKWSLREKIQTLSPKISHGRLQENSNIVSRLGKLWYFGKAVAEERWSVIRSGRNLTGGSTDQFKDIGGHIEGYTSRKYNMSLLS